MLAGVFGPPPADKFRSHARAQSAFVARGCSRPALMIGSWSAPGPGPILRDREPGRAAGPTLAEQDLGGSDNSAPTQETGLRRSSAGSMQSPLLWHRTS